MVVSEALPDEGEPGLNLEHSCIKVLTVDGSRSHIISKDESERSPINQPVGESVHMVTTTLREASCPGRLCGHDRHLCGRTLLSMLDRIHGETTL